MEIKILLETIDLISKAIVNINKAITKVENYMMVYELDLVMKIYTIWSI